MVSSPRPALAWVVVCAIAVASCQPPASTEESSSRAPQTQGHEVAPPDHRSSPHDHSSAATQTGSQPSKAQQEEPYAVIGDVFGLPYAMTDLDNGLRVVVLKTEIPDVVALQILVRTGSRNETEPGKSGFAHFFEHMMFRGTEKFPAEAYSEILKKAGADQNAYTSDDLTNYHVTFTKNDLDKILEIEADRFQNLSYSKEQFKTEALAVKGEYLKNYSNPIRRMLEKSRSLAFVKHPYKHTTMGLLADIEKMPDQLEYAKTFFDQRYRPEKTVILVVGDIDAKATIAKVKSHFGAWKRGTFEDHIPVEPPATHPKYAHLKLETPTQPWLMLAFRSPAFEPTSLDAAALEVVATLAFSKASPVYRKLVIEDQKCDQLWAWFPKRRDPHLFHIAARLHKAEYASEVRDTIYKALAELRHAPLDAPWVERTKSRLRYEMAAQFGDSTSIADSLANVLHFERTPETLGRLFEQYAQITPEDIHKASRKYFTDAGRVLVTLSTSQELASFNPLDALETTTATASAPLFGQAKPPLVLSEDKAVTSTTTASSQTILMPSASPLVTLSYIFNVGAAFDPAGQKGLAALTALMVSNAGTKAHSIAQINEAMYPMAANFEAQVDKEMTRFSGTVHKDNLSKFYTLSSQQLLTPGFRDEDLELNKKKLISQISSDLIANNDEELGKEVLYELIYSAEHPYGSYNLGTVEDIKKLTLADVQAFYKQYYNQETVVLGLAGAYPNGFEEKARNNLSHLSASSTVAKTIEISPPTSSGDRRALIVEKKTPGVAVSMGFPIAIRRGDPDWISLWLARSWLGEHRNSISHLYQEIREKRGMNYGNYAYIEYFPRGMFQNYPDANLGRRHQIFQIWLRPFRTNKDAQFGTRLAVDELEQLVRNGLTQQQFEATRSFLYKFASLLTQTQARQLGYAIDSNYYGIPDFTTYVRRELDRLTLEQVNQAIKKHLKPEELSFVFISRDAAGMLRRLSRELPSEMTYNSPKPALSTRDKEVAHKKLNIDRVTFRPVDDLF